MGESIGHAAVFDVMSNIWGRSPDFASYNNANTLTSFARIQNEKYDLIVDTGRGGLGAIIVQAAGNDQTNANGDAANSTRFTATVAATYQNGDIAYYSNYGTGILISAPASNLTTDITGPDGYTSGNYVHGFGGASAATPVVSWVVALMLEAAPDLGWRDVQNILALSAAHTGSDWGAGAKQYEVDTWMDNGAENWTGGGMSFSRSYGFGMVDAFAAVRLAEVWIMISSASATLDNEAHFSVTGGAVSITDGGTVLDTISGVTDIRLEHIEVSVDIDHSRGGDLTIELISPDGIKFRMFEAEIGWNGTEISQSFTFDADWAFGVTGVLGTSAFGDCTLRVTDALGGGTGTIFDWAVDFYGSNATVDDVHHFTQDFLSYAQTQTGRTSLADSNGGTDWIQLTSIIDDVVADMAVDITVAGTLWTTLAGTVENIATGDGDVWVSGTADANNILAGRGADWINGLGGDDLLRGGSGADYLIGGGGRDVADYGGSGVGLVVDLAAAWVNAGEATGDVFQGIDGLNGSAHDDTLRGGSLGDTLRGGSIRSGNDISNGRKIGGKMGNTVLGIRCDVDR